MGTTAHGQNLTTTTLTLETTAATTISEKNSKPK